MSDQELGVVLIVLGVVIMVFSFFGGVLGGLVCALGLVLLIVGIVFAARQPPAAPYYYAQPAYGAPGYPPQGYPPQQPAAGQPAPTAPTAPGAPAAPYQAPACYVCGTGLTWVPQYGRWYCYRCQAYR